MLFKQSTYNIHPGFRTTKRAIIFKILKNKIEGASSEPLTFLRGPEDLRSLCDVPVSKTFFYLINFVIVILLKKLQFLLTNDLFLGGNFEDLGKIDGVDQWKSLTDSSKQVRSKILINIDETRGEEALIFNQWKVVKSKFFHTESIVYMKRYVPTVKVLKL